MNDISNSRLWWMIGMIWLCFTTSVKAESSPVDVQEIVFSHIQDAYTWHITKWNGKEITISLPVLVKSEERGWSFFFSHNLHDGNAYDNYYLATEGDHAGKVVEKNSRGEVVRPLDLSLTKNVCGLFISCTIILFIILWTARWYKKHPNEVPGGFIGLIETAICYMQDNVIKGAIGKDYKRYNSYLLTVFFFILINNLIGIIPVFPGGANVTGNIAVTGVLAACTFIVVNLFATKNYWKEIFWPKAPIYLKLPLPIMPLVEFFGVFTKPFALMIRLFANIMAGHTIILALTCLIFITTSMGLLVNFGMTIVSVFFSAFMNCLELLVACLQAYIFTLLSANYIGLAKVED
ncbi:ATP synthase F0 subcomplex A subunit [Parabacteroides chinchillae]|uniref:ATP synthase subunit a n=2 Tax=Parabacteroides chinchillae TaxID=871327 RepID=A0A8G2BWX9_9BACT|nr:ATP synthase F0 subcomplex A subunit [Parabacteroides chinchillae]